MKKKYLLVMLAVGLLASCSNENSVMTGQGIDDGSPEVDPNAVKIELGTQGMSTDVTPGTRATLDAWNNTGIGIFALAKGITEPWTLTDNNTCIMNNVKGIVATGATGTDVSITLDKKYYYPMSSLMNYSFYGYYPHQNAAANIANDGNVVTVKYPTFDGTQDIIYGSAVATAINGIDGYNAKYFRNATGATTPTIKFKHLLTSLRFYVKAAGLTPTEIEASKKLKITSIKIIKVPNNVSLVVSDKQGNTGGTLSFTEPVEEASVYTLKKVDGTNADGVIPADGNGTLMGDCIMLPVNAAQKDDRNLLYYIAEIAMESTEPGAAAIPVSRVQLFVNNGGAYEAGKYYNVNLSVYGLSEIKIQANLKEWEAGGSSDVEIN